MPKNFPLSAMNKADNALLALGHALREQGYRFVTITPESQRRVNARSECREAATLRDMFGWSRPFRAEILSPSLLALLTKSGAVERCGSLLRSTVRYSTLDGEIYVHSAYPTREADAVFFGPDSYRFAALIRQALAHERSASFKRIVDIGCGAGVGGIVLSRLLDGRQDRLITFADINARALRYARVNASLAGIECAEFIHSDVLEAIVGPVDLIVANPPYLVDPHARLYRDGGADLGCALSIRIVRESLQRLAPGGRLILYTGAPIVAGRDIFFENVEALLVGLRYDYTEIDPDVFGEELEQPAYAAVERIAVVSLITYRS